LFPVVYRSYRGARSKGLSPEVLDAAALGVLATFRRPTPPTPAARAPIPSYRGTTPWAHEGRVRLMAGRQEGRARHPDH
ncbi:MAG TPA: hypothetical protein VLY85_02910, partial [Thermoplasmata archaeon]|nr:hypothetical protein [Thermoplasmata archaeon]